MKNLAFIYTPLLLTMAACSEGEWERRDPNGDIQLGAAVGDLRLNSRAEAVPFLPQEGKALKAAVWLKPEDDPGYGETTTDSGNGLPVRTTVEFKGTAPEYVYDRDGNSLQYPTDNSGVCCIGLFPDSGWEANEENTTVTHLIDGTEDLMFANEIEGSWKNHFGTQTYHHLLTWIKINICATSHDAVDAWGTIEQISVNSASTVTVDLESETYSYGEDEREIETIDDGKACLLSTAIREVGSVFCSPNTAYTVTVTYTDKSGVSATKSREIKLNILSDDDTFKEMANADDARGKCFVFSLYFTPFNVIEGACMLNAWNNQNEDIYITDEDNNPQNNKPDEEEETLS